MKTILFSIAALGLATSVAAAQDMTFAEVDTDLNGELSFAELTVAWPDLSQEEFDGADIDVSGGLSADELGSIQGAATVSTDAPADEAVEAVEPVESLGP